MQHTATDTACVVLESFSLGRMKVSIPTTYYELDLVDSAFPSGRSAAEQACIPTGSRLHGVVHARALKMHRANAGGVFIEPVQGHPRSVQGRVMATDTVNNKILAHVVIPMWIAVPAGQAAADFATGELINFYVQSGTSFVAAAVV